MKKLCEINARRGKAGGRKLEYEVFDDCAEDCKEEGIPNLKWSRNFSKRKSNAATTNNRARWHCSRTLRYSWLGHGPNCVGTSEPYDIEIDSAVSTFWCIFNFLYYVSWLVIFPNMCAGRSTNQSKYFHKTRIFCSSLEYRNKEQKKNGLKKYLFWEYKKMGG